MESDEGSAADSRISSFYSRSDMTNDDGQRQFDTTRDVSQFTTDDSELHNECYSNDSYDCNMDCGKKYFVNPVVRQKSVRKPSTRNNKDYVNDNNTSSYFSDTDTLSVYRHTSDEEDTDDTNTNNYSSKRQSRIQTDYGASPPSAHFKSKKSKRAIQTCVLVSICILYGVHGGTIEAPASLQEQIMAELDVDAFRYNLLYSLYSFPNIILVFIGGIVVDSILGLRMSGIVYTGLLLLGQIIMAIGAFTRVFPLMVIGRFIYGIGGESFQIVTQKYIVRWFRGKMLNIAFGIAFSFYRVCGFLQFNLNQRIYSFLRSQFGFSGPYSIGIAFMIGACGIFLGLLFSVVLFLFDKKYQPKQVDSHTGKLKQLLNNVRQISKFNPNFYILCVCLVFFSISYYPFNQLAQGFFISKYLRYSDQAIFTLSISNIVGTVASPIFGLAISYIGYDLYIQNFIYILQLLVHSGYAFTFISPIVLIVFNGLANSMFTCVFWPLPARIIKEEQLGIAYGVMLCLQNLGLAIVPLVTGTIVDVSGYLYFEFHILFLGSIAAIFASVLVYTNVVLSNGILNESACARKKAPTN